MCLKGSAAETEEVKFLCIAIYKFLLRSQLPSQLAHTNQMSDGFCDFTWPLGTSQELGLAINPVKLCPIVKFGGEITLKI